MNHSIDWTIHWTLWERVFRQTHLNKALKRDNEVWSALAGAHKRIIFLLLFRISQLWPRIFSFFFCNGGGQWTECAFCEHCDRWKTRMNGGLALFTERCEPSEAGHLWTAPGEARRNSRWEKKKNCPLPIARQIETRINFELISF